MRFIAHLVFLLYSFSSKQEILFSHSFDGVFGINIIMISGTVPDPFLEVCPIKSTTGAYKETMILRDDNYTDIWMNIRKNSKLPLIFIFVCFRTKPPLTEYWRNSWYQCRRCSLPSSFDSLGVLHTKEAQEEEPN